MPEGLSTRGSSLMSQFGHKEKFSPGQVVQGNGSTPRGAGSSPVSVFANGWIPCSRCHACVHTRCTLISTLQASLSSAQDPAVSTGCSMGRGPQEELQHSHSTRQRLPVNN